ncbi:hypothetical protein SAMN06295885_3277 [Rathayibacter oskolensis]|uniref:Uncharacterized protein n=1 Tax=Rathayibacter oskolensis TaxID=1891671 RepID=A0A1X7PDB0_9MICO|nr:hypothetical protein [Rathayibacter oskolensis]SMH49330.1 hypothetical protein SAMN06295885_3277 [Rathayibacter oskolensis]
MRVSAVDRMIAEEVGRWQAWLAFPEVGLTDGGRGTCPHCPRYAAFLELDEYVHQALHPLIVDSVAVVRTLTIEAATRDAGVERHSFAFVGFESGVVVDAGIDAEASGLIESFFFDAHARMLVNLWSRRLTIATALALEVEPKVLALLPEGWR